MKFKHLLFSAGVLISGTVCAENLIHNGDFQLGNSGFSMASPLERCDSDVSMLGFSALADKGHGAACRYAQIHYAGRCRQ